VLTLMSSPVVSQDGDVCAAPLRGSLPDTFGEGQSLLSYCLDTAAALDVERTSSDPERPLKRYPTRFWFDNPAYCISPTVSPAASLKKSDVPFLSPAEHEEVRSSGCDSPLARAVGVLTLTAAPSVSSAGSRPSSTRASATAASEATASRRNSRPDSFAEQHSAGESTARASTSVDHPSVGARADRPKTVTFRADQPKEGTFTAEVSRAAFSPRSPPLTPKGVTANGAASKVVTFKLPPLTLKTGLSPSGLPKNLPGTPPLGSPKLSPLTVGRPDGGAPSFSRTDRAAPSTGRPDSAPSAPPRRRPDYTAPSRPNSPAGLPKNMPDRSAPSPKAPPSAPPAGRPDCGAPSISRPDRAPTGRPDLAAPSLEAPPSRNGQRATTFRIKVARA